MIHFNFHINVLVVQLYYMLDYVTERGSYVLDKKINKTSIISIFLWLDNIYTVG